MNPVITPATAAEKADYLAKKPVYPLLGWVTVSGHRCAVENLSEWEKPDPQFEVMAPAGFHFDGDLHTLLAHSRSDLRERIACHELHPCDCENR